MLNGLHAREDGPSLQWYDSHTLYHGHHSCFLWPADVDESGTHYHLSRADVVHDRPAGGSPDEVQRANPDMANMLLATAGGTAAAPEGAPPAQIEPHADSDMITATSAGLKGHGKATGDDSDGLVTKEEGQRQEVAAQHGNQPFPEAGLGKGTGAEVPELLVQVGWAGSGEQQ